MLALVDVAELVLSGTKMISQVNWAVLFTSVPRLQVLRIRHSVGSARILAALNSMISRTDWAREHCVTFPSNLDTIALDDMYYRVVRGNLLRFLRTFRDVHAGQRFRKVCVSSCAFFYVKQLESLEDVVEDVAWDGSHPLPSMGQSFGEDTDDFDAMASYA